LNAIAANSHQLVPISAPLTPHLRGKVKGGTTKKIDQEETMKSGNTVERETSTKSDLASRYRAVGILAVAAALPYQSDAKNSAYAPCEAEPDERFEIASA